jgi:hypothetical protein
MFPKHGKGRPKIIVRITRNELPSGHADAFALSPTGQLYQLPANRFVGEGSGFDCAEEACGAVQHWPLGLKRLEAANKANNFANNSIENPV